MIRPPPESSRTDTLFPCTTLFRAVKLGLQADCYAGLWTHHVESLKDDNGEQILELDDGDIEEAVGAAYTVGDDHIQEVTGGRVDANQWTHGTSEKRIERKSSVEGKSVSVRGDPGGRRSIKKKKKKK